MTAGGQNCWPDARVAELRRMVGEGGLGPSAMGRVLGLSRGAVSMKLKRLGLVWVPPARVAKVRKTQLPKAAPLLPITHADGSQVTLENVGEGECRFPYGDLHDGELVLCGRPTNDGAIYCEAHRRIAFKRCKPKEVAS